MHVLVVWLYGTLVLAASGLPVVHMTNRGGAVGAGIAESGGAFFFAWTLIALGVTAIFSVILSARRLRGLQRASRGPGE